MHLGQRGSRQQHIPAPCSLAAFLPATVFLVVWLLLGEGRSILCLFDGGRGKEGKPHIGKKSRRGQAPEECGLASAPGKGKFSLWHSFPEREGEGSWCVSPDRSDKGVFPRGPLAGRMHRTHLERTVPQRFYPFICHEAFRRFSVKFQGKIPLGTWVDNLQAVTSYLAAFTPHIFIWPPNWKCAVLQ